MAIKGIFIIALSILFLSNVTCQVTIWNEDFNYPDGTMSAENNNQTNPAIDWVSGGCTACIDTADWWKIRSGAMEARDVNELVYLVTEEITISNFTDVEFSLDIMESGDHEGPYFGLATCPDQANEDFVNVCYRIDGGNWNLIGNALNWCGLYDSCNSHTLYGDDGINSGDCRDNDTDWGSASVTQSGIQGNILEIKVEAINSSDTEIIRIDRLRITGNLLLPVVLKTFIAHSYNNQVQLQWETVSESGNDYFMIERSQSATGDWTSIAKVHGAGTSNQARSYFYEDTNPLWGKSYYRLKQVDFDGHHVYLPIASIFTEIPLDPYPNPAINFLTVPFHCNNPPKVQLYDMQLRKIEVPIEISASHLILDLRYIARNSYLLKTSQVGSCNKTQLIVVH